MISNHDLIFASYACDLSSSAAPDSGGIDRHRLYDVAAACLFNDIFGMTDVNMITESFNRICSELQDEIVLFPVSKSINLTCVRTWIYNEIRQPSLKEIIFFRRRLLQSEAYSLARNR